MVGTDGGAQDIRKIYIQLSMLSNDGIAYWQSKTFVELRPWIEAFAEGADDNG